MKGGKPKVRFTLQIALPCGCVITATDDRTPHTNICRFHKEVTQ